MYTNKYYVKIIQNTVCLKFVIKKATILINDFVLKSQVNSKFVYITLVKSNLANNKFQSRKLFGYSFSFEIGGMEDLIMLS